MSCGDAVRPLLAGETAIGNVAYIQMDTDKSTYSWERRLTVLPVCEEALRVCGMAHLFAISKQAVLEMQRKQLLTRKIRLMANVESSLIRPHHPTM